MRQILLASAALAALAVAAPGLIDRYLDGRAEGAAPDSQARPVLGVARGGDEVEIAASRDGHFYVEAEINLRPVRLMVDTGASVVALRLSDAEAVGLRPRPADYDRPVQTANGTAQAAAAELESVTIGGIEVNGVDALILPDAQLGISLLGASFLNRLGRFEVTGGTLVLQN